MEIALMTWVLVPAQPHAGCVTLGKFHLVSLTLYFNICEKGMIIPDPVKSGQNKMAGGREKWGDVSQGV